MKNQEKRILIFLILLSTLILTSISIFTSYATYVTNPPNILLIMGFSQMQISIIILFGCLGIFSMFWSLIFIGRKEMY